jgi:hypothetical protein
MSEASGACLLPRLKPAAGFSGVSSEASAQQLLPVRQPCWAVFVIWKQQLRFPDLSNVYSAGLRLKLGRWASFSLHNLHLHSACFRVYMS